MSENMESTLATGAHVSVSVCPWEDEELPVTTKSSARQIYFKTEYSISRDFNLNYSLQIEK